MKIMRVIAVIMFMLAAETANAFGWSDITDYITSWFSPDNTTPSNEIVTTDTLPENIASDWDKLTANLSDVLVLRDKQETLPSSAWFGEDKNSNARKMNELLDVAVKILSGSEAGNTRGEAIKLRARIASLKAEADSLRNARITAPESTYMFWRKTKASIDAKIAEIEAEVTRMESEMSAITAKLADELSSTGLTLTETQTEILINSVTGEDILQNVIIFDNVKAVVTKLEELSQQDTNTLEITKRYTGMYLVLNDLLIHTDGELLKKIETEYKPKLAAIRNEAEKLRREAQSKSENRAYTAAQRQSFSRNVRANGTTIEAARLYERLLNNQKAALQNSIKALKLNRELAENTYRTVRSSRELRLLIHSGLEAFDAITGLSMPELKMFESGIMREEFDEINRRLNQ